MTDIADTDIRSLRDEAASVGDLTMVAICDLAVDGEIHERGPLTAEERADVARRFPTQDAARAECARVIREAQD